MKPTLFKAKQSCPFLLKYFHVDVQKNMVAKDFLQQFSGLCPYMAHQKAVKKMKITNAISLQENGQAAQQQCPMRKVYNLGQKLQDISQGQQQQQKQMDYQHNFDQAIQSLKNEGRYRVFNYIQRKAGEFPKAMFYSSEEAKPKEITFWCSNDYLGMAQHPEVIQAMVQSVKKSGTGAGGTRNIGGSSIHHFELEKSLAKLHNKEAALVMSSGFVANQATLNSLAKLMPNIIYLSDANNHASIIEGIRNSRADKVIWKHNDIEDLEQKLQKIDFNRPKCIVFESVYSMSGSVSNIQAVCALAKKYNALTVLDEVHAIGLYGQRGAGVAELFGCEQELDFITGTLGKAIGCYGGYVVGGKNGIDCIRSFAPNFIFTTSIPPNVAAAANASVTLIMKHPEMREKLHKVANMIKNKLSQAGIPILPSDSHIIPVFIGNAVKAKQASDILLERYNMYIQPINFPTVPRGQEILRISPSPNHTEEMVDILAESLNTIFAELQLKEDMEKYFSQINSLSSNEAI